MSNLIERLRSNFPTTQAQWEAADRIEELEHKLACAEYEIYMRQEECEIVRDINDAMLNPKPMVENRK